MQGGQRPWEREREEKGIEEERKEKERDLQPQRKGAPSPGPQHSRVGFEQLFYSRLRAWHSDFDFP